MVFAGEASWRWKMMVPSTDRVVRVLLAPGGALAVDRRRRIRSRSACPTRRSRATRSRSTSTPATRRSRRCRRDRRRDADAAGRRGAAAQAAARGCRRRPLYGGARRRSSPGCTRLHAEARRGATQLGAADRWMYVGGADREFADPRLNEGFLRRVARNSGGRYVRAADASKVPAWLRGGRAAERRAARAATCGTSRGRSR